MIRIRWLIPVVVALGVVAAGCEDSEEASPTNTATQSAAPTSAPATETATATTEPTPTTTQLPGGAGGGEEGTPVPIVSPIPPESVIPPDWPTFHDAEGGYSFRYPVGWYEDPVNRRVQSFDPKSWSSDLYPDGGIVVEVHVTPADDGAPAPSPIGATDATFAGLPAWRIVRTYEQATEGQISWSHGLSTLHNDRNYTLIGFFEQPNPDDSVFLQIADSFEFDK